MAKNTIAPIAQRRVALYEKMSPDLQKVTNKFDGLFSKMARGNLLVSWDMGKDIDTIVQEEGKYGANAVGQLATYFGYSETWAYNLRNVNQTWTREQVEELSQRPLSNGFRLTFKHLLAISTLKREGDRKKMLERVFVEGLSAEQVVNEGGTKKSPRSGGRKPSRPTTPNAGAQLLYSETLKLNNRLESLKEPLFDEVDQMPVDKLDEALLEKLKLADEQLSTLEEKVTGYHDRLRTNINRCTKAVESKQTDVEFEATEPAAPTAKRGRGRPRKAAAAEPVAA